MKNIKQLVMVVACSLGLTGAALAQADQDQYGGKHHGDPAMMLKHLTEVYPKVAAYDTNKDGKLDQTEQDALAKAIADGTVTLGPERPHDGGDKPDPAKMVTHVAGMFEKVAAYDVNHDGQLDDSEQAALKAAIEKGDFKPHGEHPPHHGGNGQ